MKDADKLICIMKVASGNLSGSELMLKVDAHRIITGPEYAFCSETDDNGFTTYYLPSELCRYELAIISSNAATSRECGSSDDKLFLAVSGDLPKTTLPINFQELMLSDHFPVIIKPLNGNWNIPESPVCQSIHAKGVKDLPIKTPALAGLKTKLAYVAGITLLVLTVVWLGINYDSNVRKVKTLQSLLQGSSSPLTVTTGGNGKSLVLVQTQRDVDWSTQRLLQQHYSEPVAIKKISTLEAEIEARLDNLLPNLLKVDLSRPDQPIVRLLRGNYSNPDKELIQKILNQSLLSYSHVIVEVYTPEELLQRVEQGLAESNVPWRRVNKKNTSIFIINASMNDKQTISVIDFAERFAKKWGVRSVQFSVSLATNPLVGRSFVQNSNGYVLLDNNHWLFNTL